MRFVRVALLTAAVFAVALAFVGATAFTIEIVGHLQEGTDP